MKIIIVTKKYGERYDVRLIEKCDAETLSREFDEFFDDIALSKYDRYFAIEFITTLLTEGEATLTYHDYDITAAKVQ